MEYCETLIGITMLLYGNMKTSLKWFAAALVTVVLAASLAILLHGTQSVAASPVRVACVGDSITRDTTYPEVLSTISPM
jgi:uncharacterized membrane-anchored protein